MVIVESLTKKFGYKAAVDHISFIIAKGEVFGLVGPTGAGKTTTVKMLTTLFPPTAGTALFTATTSGSSRGRCAVSSATCPRRCRPTAILPATKTS